MSTSPRSKATACSTTRAAGSSATSRSASGIANASFGTSAAWVDYDRDGRLDLFVANYVRWTSKTDLRCSLDGATKSYCTPESYSGTASRLYRNLGAGRFGDVSKAAGVDDPTSKSLGVAVLDYDGDAWPDLFVANDTQPNKLYRNNRNGTFSESGLRAGVAYSEEGIARGAMGVDAADYDRSGRPHLLVGNFSNQMLGLYHNEGKGLFVDEAPRSTVGRASLLTLAFGVFFFDYDLDGWPDILAANGHIEEEIGRVQPKVQYRQPPLVFRNLGTRRFEHVTGSLGADFARPIVARGARVLRITTTTATSTWLSPPTMAPPICFGTMAAIATTGSRSRTRGTKSNRDGIGALVRVDSGGVRQWQMVRSGSSYASQSDLDPHVRPRRQRGSRERGGRVAQRDSRPHRRRPDAAGCDDRGRPGHRPVRLPAAAPCFEPSSLATVKPGGGR